MLCFSDVSLVTLQFEAQYSDLESQIEVIEGNISGIRDLLLIVSLRLGLLSYSTLPYGTSRLHRIADIVAPHFDTPISK